MGSYSTVSFTERTEGGMRPEWVQERNITRRHIPYSNLDDVQDTGRGNHRITVQVNLASDAALTNLKAMQNMTARTLTLWGTVYANTYLVGLRNPRRAAHFEYLSVELEFERLGT
jgi:hypothetical protein